MAFFSAVFGGGGSSSAPTGGYGPSSGEVDTDAWVKYYDQIAAEFEALVEELLPGYDMELPSGEEIVNQFNGDGDTGDEGEGGEDAPGGTPEGVDPELMEVDGV